MKRKYLLANWKMNLDRSAVDAYSEKFLNVLSSVDLEGVQLGIAPTSLWIERLKSKLGQDSSVWTGAQDVSSQSSGAYTGEVSAAMLASAGTDFVLVGHSERRQWHGESSVECADKLERAFENGLRPVYCIGEKLDEREHASGVVSEQLHAVASALTGYSERTFIIAYEPVWAIGTGLVPTNAEIESLHKIVRSELTSMLGSERSAAVPILYGGSANAANACELLKIPNVDGLLVGGASLKPDSFLEMARYAQATVSL